MPTTPTKNIVICSDGTGNTAIKGRGTNIFKLYEAVDLEGQRENPGRVPPQICFYDDGVGTSRLRLLAALGGAFGIGLSRNVRELYADLARVYEPGDRIFLFGFSRGAFTVRTLSGFIAACGIVDRRECDSDDELKRRVYRAYRAYRDRYRTRLMQLFRGPASDAPESVIQVRTQWAVQHPDGRGDDIEPWQVPIAFIGVWDTVDAVGFPVPWFADLWNTTVYRFKFPDHVLGPMVECARHALAIDDERHTFHPLLWDERSKEGWKRKVAPDRIEQVWFSGAHANVGGGYPKQGMSVVSLVWMMDEAEAAGLKFSSLDRQLYRERQNVYDQLYDSRAGLKFFYRYLPRDVDRMCREHHTLPKFHASVIRRILYAPQGYAPGNVPRDTRIVGASEPVVAALVQEMRRQLGEDRSLLDRVQSLIMRRRVAQYAVMALAGVVGIMALRSGEWSSADLSAGALLQGVAWFVVEALRTATWSVLALLLGMGLAYLVTWLAGRRMKHVFSTFWFRVRPQPTSTPAVRTQTPGVATPSAS